MPYVTTKELPDNLQRLLPLKAQEQLITLYNKAYQRGGPEGYCWAYAWWNLKNIGWEKDRKTGMWVYTGNKYVEDPQAFRKLRSNSIGTNRGARAKARK